MRRYLSVLALLPLLLIGASCEEEDESGPVTVLEDEPGLLAQATVPPDSAVALARARVPDAHISKAEIEQEDGRLIYSFDMTPGGEEGEEAEEAEEPEEGEGMILEVHIDALSGAVLSVVEESAGEEDEAAEAEEEGEEEAEEGMAAGPGQVTEESPGLFEQAAFAADSALALARVRFPGARLLAGELEMEGEHLVYSLDLEIQGEEGITEVWVDARTGEILSVEHEGEGEEGEGGEGRG
jgi:uncharacterized membrane protein YkoI